MKKILMALLGGIVTLAISGCANDMETPPDEKSEEPAVSQESTVTQESVAASAEIIIGGILPLTDEAGTYGISMQKIAEIALREINEDGGVNGKKLAIRWEDGKCNAEAAAAAANKLINEDKVSIIYGGFCNAETWAIAPIAEKAGVVVFSPASSAPDLTNAGEYIFRNYPSDAHQGKTLAEEAIKKSYKKIAVLSEKHSYNLGIQKAFEEKIKELGGSVDIRTYQSDETDTDKALEELKAGTPDALFINPQTPGKADLAFNKLEKMKWEIPLIGNDIVAGYQDLITKHKDLVGNMIIAEFRPDTDNPNFIALEDKYKEMTGEDLPYNAYAATTYDAVYILRDALTTAGYDSAKLKEYLSGIRERTGLAGTLTMDSNGDPSSGYKIEVIKEGKIVDSE